MDLVLTRTPAKSGLQIPFGGECPSTMAMPDGYEVDGASVWRVWGEGETRGRALVSRAPIVVVGQQRDADTDAVSLDLAWPVPGRKTWHRMTAPRHHVVSARRVVDLAEHGAPVSSGEAAEVVRWLAALDAQCKGQVASTTRLGWHRDDQWSSGAWSSAGAPAWRDTGSGVDLVRASIRQHGDAAAWIAEAAAIAEEHPFARVALAAAVAPVLLDWIGGHGFVVEFAAPTGSGKSTLLRLASSVWAASQEGAYMRTWDDTRVYLSAIAGSLHHHPLVVDETKRCGGDWAKVRDMIYALHSGTDKGRGQQDASARRPKTYRSLMLISGESPVAYALPDGGIRGRVLTMTGRPLKSAADADRIVQLCEDHYGHVGPMLARRCVEATAATRLEVRTTARQMAAYYAAHRLAQGHPTSARLAAYAGTLAAAGEWLGAVMGLDHPASWWMPDKAWESALAATADADAARTTHEEVWAWAQTCGRLHGGSGELRAPAQGWIGRAVDGGLALLKAEVRRYCSAVGRDFGEWSATAEQRGWISKGTRVVKIDGAAVRCIVMRDLDGLSEGEEAQAELPLDDDPSPY